MCFAHSKTYKMLRKTKYTKDMDVTAYMICGTNINAQRSSIQKNYMIQQDLSCLIA